MFRNSLDARDIGPRFLLSLRSERKDFFLVVTHCSGYVFTLVSVLRKERESREVM